MESCWFSFGVCKQNIIEVERRESLLISNCKGFGEVYGRKGQYNSGRDNSPSSYQIVVCPGCYKQLIQTLTQFEYTVKCIYNKVALDSFAGFNYAAFLYLLGSLKDHSRFIQEQMQIHIEKIHIELILTAILKTK